jgi:hypothetical protein
MNVLEWVHKMAQQTLQTYQLKITLNGAKPPIWRRVKVSGATDLFDLHDIIQIAMGWTDSHLHQFVAGEKRYGAADDEYDTGMIDEDGVRIDALLKKEKQSIDYEYDFGDGWGHKIVLEKITPATPDDVLPICIGGSRACPPEDVGGVWGYEEFLKAYSDKDHPEHEDRLEWAGEDFDPEHFDPDEVNEILSGE